MKKLLYICACAFAASVCAQTQLTINNITKQLQGPSSTIVVGNGQSITATGTGVIVATSGSAPALTSTYVGYGDGSNALTGEAAFTYTASTNTLGAGVFAAGDGSAAAPSMSFASAPTLGFFKSAGTVLGIAANGLQTFRIGTMGVLRGGTVDNYLQLAADGSISLVAAGGDQSILVTPSGIGGVVIPNGAVLGWGGLNEGITGSAVSGTLALRTNAATVIALNSARDATFFGHVLADGNNAKDIGSSTNAFRTLYVGNGINMLGDTIISRGGVGQLSITGSIAPSGPIIESTDARNGPGAVSVTKTTTKVTSTGVLDALSLADGVDGQIKRIVHDVDGGSFVLTPTTKTGWSTYTSTVVGETISIQFVTTRGWMVIGSHLGTIAP